MSKLELIINFLLNQNPTIVRNMRLPVKLYKHKP